MNLRAVVALTVLLGACATHDFDQPACQGESVSRFVESPPPLLDVLLVLDDSPAMQGAREQIRRSLASLVSRLRDRGGTLPDLHLGMVSGDLGTGPFAWPGCTPGGQGARLQMTARQAGCVAPAGRFIIDEESAQGRVRNYAGDLSDALACVAPLGASGCAVQQPLSAVSLALAGTIPENAGFLRKDAFLLVVFISTTDDCSAAFPSSFFDPAAALGPATPFRCAAEGPFSPHLRGVADLVDALVRLKGGARNRLLVMTIAGPSTPPIEVGVDPLGNPVLLPACVTPHGAATAAPRLQQFAAGFGDNGAFASFCADDWSPAWRRLGDLQASTLNGRCLLGDLAPQTADAPQATALTGRAGFVSCTVEDRVSPTHGDPWSEVLPACSEGDPRRPCFRLVHSPQRCPSSHFPSQLELVVDRLGLLSDTTVELRCQTSVAACGAP